MAGLKTYDPKGVIGTWEAPFQNVALQEGIAAGTFISITNEAPRWAKNTGSDGESTRVKSNNRNGTMAITYRQGAPINALLNAISNEDDADNAQVGPFTLEDLNGSSLVLVERPFWPGQQIQASPTPKRVGSGRGS
jgi:hypothetical protein